MNVYVVVVNDIVVGAGVDFAAAETIADRHADDPNVEPWVHAHNADSWARRLNRQQRQRIVRVPLAGAPRTFDRPSLAELSSMPLGIVTKMPEPPPPITADDLVRSMNLIRKIAANRVRCGTGEALAWIRAALERMPDYPDKEALPISAAAGRMNIDMVIDPNLPPNVFKIGDRTFMVNGHSEIYKISAQAFDPITNPPR